MSDVIPAYPHVAGGRRSSSERARRRTEANEAERAFLSALDARADLSDRRIRAPKARERVAARSGGGYKADVGGNYDWFWELAPEERARIRENWMTTDRSAMSPDEVEETGMPMGEWLALTRGIDAARAVKAGRHLQAKRYGGRHPLKHIEAGAPDEHGTRVDAFHSRKGEAHYINPAAGVQFFTDEKGIVHPIRASYQTTETGGRRRWTGYGWADDTPKAAEEDVWF